MSVSCLDVYYRISYRRKKKKLKCKQEDMTALTINDTKEVTQQWQEEGEEEESKIVMVTCMSYIFRPL